MRMCRRSFPLLCRRIAARVVVGGLLLAGCAPLAPPSSPDPQLSLQERNWRYLEEQQTRRSRLGRWSATGVIHLVEPEGPGQRNRFTLHGQGPWRARLSVSGPFQQEALRVEISPQWVRVIEASQRRVIQGPPTRDSLSRLSQRRLDVSPLLLLQMVLGLGPADPPLGESPAGQSRWSDEDIRLEESSGRILERIGTGPGLEGYRALLTWGESPADASLPLPTRLEIHRPDGGRMDLTLKSWQLDSAAPPLGEDLPPGFDLLYLTEDP
ncbi:MAG: hypothetical protein H7831_02405 [Magnetococcus sp. WYHC-3]